MDRSAQCSAPTLPEKIQECEVGKEYWVEVTHVNNPHSFFVRLVDRNLDMDLLEERGKPVEESEVTVGKLFVYLSSTLRKHVRGQVSFIHWHDVVKCDIKAIDYGCFDYAVPTSKMFIPKNPVHKLPLAIHCKLAKCAPANSENGEDWNPETTEAMIFYIGKEKTKMIVRSKMHNQLTVDLINSYPDDIATMLAYTHYSVLALGTETSVSRLKAPRPELVNPRFKTRTLHIDEVLRVRLQSGKNIKGFYVAEINQFRQHLLGHNEFSELCQHERYITESELQVGNLVACRSLNGSSYERAVVLEVLKSCNKCHLQKIDWGDTVYAPFNDIKPISEEKYTQKPALAIFCSTDRKSATKNGLSKFLCPGFEMMIKVKEFGDGFNEPYVVEVFPRQI